jgi:hypothetical protein
MIFCCVTILACCVTILACRMKLIHCPSEEVFTSRSDPDDDFSVSRDDFSVSHETNSRLEKFLLQNLNLCYYDSYVNYRKRFCSHRRILYGQSLVVHTRMRAIMSISHLLRNQLLHQLSHSLLIFLFVDSLFRESESVWCSFIFCTFVFCCLKTFSAT